MAINIIVPDLGESVIEATVARWLKKEGDTVNVGEPVVVLETDKVDLEVGADRGGVLAKIDQPAGADVKIGDVLGSIEESAGTAPAAGASAAPSAPAPVSKPAPAPASAPAAAPVAASATPVARRVAEDQQVDLGRVEASSGGRVTKADVERFVEGQKATPAALTAAPTPMAAPATVPISNVHGRAEERVKMSRRRRTIAQRLVEAQHTAAMLTTFNEIDMTGVQQIREKHKERFKTEYGIGLGLSSFFVKAVIGALKTQPRLNSELQGDEVVLKHYYDIGMAIGAEEGLVVPVIRDADKLSFGDIEKAIKKFAAQANDGSLSLDSLRGGTFTITNGGVFGSLMSTPILNPPQVAILGLHKIQQRPVAVNGEVVIRPMMYTALSYDHRVVDGREAVQFLVRVKDLLEDPERLLIEG